MDNIRRRCILCCLLFLGSMLGLCAQTSGHEELKLYDHYVKGLACYKESGQLSMDIGKQFAEGNIAEVRRLAAKRGELLLRAIDSVLSFRPDALRSEVAALMVTRLAFNLDFEQTEKVVSRFASDFNPPCLQELRATLEKERQVRPGMPAPDFKVFDKDGREYTLNDFQGKFIFLEFSASWCSWCKKEIPAIRKAYERFKDRVVFITIHLDNVREKWLKDLEAHAVPWLCLTDLQAWESPMAKAYNISGVPNCFVIDPDRVIKAKELRGAEISDALERFLAKNEGIRFHSGTFSEALQEAKASGRLVFMDCYTSWCAPCKMMNTTVFTRPEVGRFFNERFVNVKFDMEQGEGRELSKRYGMRAFPTYLLLDAEGNEVHRVVGGHEADEFIRLIGEGADVENSILGMQRRFEAGERDADFLRKYIATLGGGYRFDKIPEVLDAYCLQHTGEINETDWQLFRRYLSEPSSFASRFIARHRKELYVFASMEDVENWIQKVLYVPVFNTVNEAVFDASKHNPERLVALRKDIKEIHPIRAKYLLAMLDCYDAYREGNMKKVLSIYKKHFMHLLGEDRFGVTMQLNAMLCEKGTKGECEEGLRIFRQIMHPADPILKNFEMLLNKRMMVVENN